MSVLPLVSLDTATGELVVAGRIDREQHPWINLTVEATDSGAPPRSSLVDVLIQVRRGTWERDKVKEQKNFLNKYIINV